MRAASQMRRDALEQMGLLPLWQRRQRVPPIAAGLACDRPAENACGANTAVGEQEMRGDVSAMDWETLQRSVAACRACSLCESRQQTVFGAGVVRPQWMLIGEAPGAEEDARGEPFVGAAGRLLSNMLMAAGLRRPDDVFIANILKCKPPANRNPTPEEIARCSPYLWRQIELVRPRLILALGRYAAQTVLSSDASITSLRGRLHQITVAGQTIPVVVTYHPAYLLRSLEEKAKSWADLCLARQTLASVTPQDRSVR